MNRCCRVLKVSRSGYYAWKKRPVSRRKEENKRLYEKIKLIHEESRKSYGLPRIMAKLKAEGSNCGKNRVSKIMRANKIVGVGRKKFKVTTTDSKHNLPIADRIFKNELAAEQVTKMNQYWASDITYIPTEEGWLFLCIFLDLFTRKIVGFSMKDHMRTEIVTEALEMALGRQVLKEETNLISHSDRGSQYAAEDCQKVLVANKITASMSRKGNCYDNAFAESFFKTLKVELVYQEKFKTRQEAKAKIFEYIEVWYNRQRLHSSLGYKSPIDYEQSTTAA